jgi:hypothetical protein
VPDDQHLDDADGPIDPQLDALRREVEAIDDIALDERAAVFERVNATIARELAALDEV